MMTVRIFNNNTYIILNSVVDVNVKLNGVSITFDLSEKRNEITQLEYILSIVSIPVSNWYYEDDKLVIQGICKMRDIIVNIYNQE